MTVKDDRYLDINIDTGADFSLTFTLYRTGSTPVDLTDAIVNAELRDYPEGETSTMFTAIHNGEGGAITIRMPHETSAALGFPYGTYNVVVTFPDGAVEDVLHGKAFISENVTRLINKGDIYHVIAFDSFDDFPAEGNLYRIYLDREVGALYFWNGTQYISLLNALKGDAATIEVGEVITGDPGTPVIVTNSGDQHHAVFDFTIPRGEQGVIYPTGNWDPTRAYTKLDMVYYEGSSYVAKENVPVGTPITDSTYWQITASKGERGASGYSEIVTMEFDPENTYYTGECVIYENEVYRLLSDYMGTGGWEAVTAQKLAVQTHKANLSVIANEFDNTTYYPAGDYVIFAGNLYRFTQNHPAGSWDITQVERMTVEDGMDDLKETIIDMHLTKPAPITDPEDDIPQGWTVLGNNFYIYDTEGQLSGQPSRYGMLYNIVGPDGTYVSQIWIMIPDGDLYVRGGNASGWGNGWIKLARDASLSNYLPLTGGTLTGPLVVKEQGELGRQDNDEIIIKSDVADSSAQSGEVATDIYGTMGMKDQNDKWIGYFQFLSGANGFSSTSVGARREVNNAAVTNDLILRVKADGTKEVSVSDPDLWRDAINAVSKSGDVMTGALTIKNWLNLQNPEISYDTTPTADVWGRPLSFTISDGTPGQIRVIYRKSGLYQLHIGVVKKVNGSSVENYIRLNIAADGTLSVQVSDKNAWLTGIGAAPASHTHSYLPLSGGTLTDNLVIKGNEKSLALKNSDGKTTGALIGTPNRVYLRSINIDTGYRIDAFLPMPEDSRTSNLTRYIPSMYTGTSALTSGTSVLDTNTIYLQYE